MAGLPEATRLALEAAEPQEFELPEDTVPGFCMVECHEGEFPLLRIFATLEGLVARMAKLEGQDVTVHPFWGIPLPFSTAPNRVLLLPGDKAIGINKSQRPVDVSEKTLEVQEDCFLGMPELSIAPPSYIKEDAARAEALAAAADADDTFDDDDETLSSPK